MHDQRRIVPRERQGLAGKLPREEGALRGAFFIFLMDVEVRLRKCQARGNFTAKGKRSDER